MSNPFIEFQNQVEAVKGRYASGEIDKTERDNLLRGMQLKDKQWGDVWMLNASETWFRQAKGSKTWIRDYPIALIDFADLPPIAEMSLSQVARAVHDCTRCPLHETRTRAVPGEGPAPADIMLIGEGPGFNEDKQARPFVGAAGQFLEELLTGIGYKRSDVYITNVVKCRPPNNRDPKPDELEACQDYLDRQIELVDPKVIVTLGRFSMYRYFPGASISKIHGQPQQFGQRLVVPMFHPAAALHQPRFRPLIEEDFQKLPQSIAEAANFEPIEDEEDLSDAEQLSLF
jgi:DNA polymerase